MNEIGKNFKLTRKESGLSLEEVSSDTKIPVTALEQIEEGSIGSFKDIFVLREYLTTYAKYLLMDDKKIIDTFNEYMFEYTTRLSANKIEKQMTKKETEEKIKLENSQAINISSPYLKPSAKYSCKKMIIILVIIVILAIIAIIWAVNMVY